MALRRVQFSSRDGGLDSPIKHRREAASQTFEPGMALIDDGSGRLTIWTADAADIEGIAVQDGHNSAAGVDDAPYYKVYTDCEFEMSVSDAGTLLTGPALANEGQAYGLAISSGILYVDLDDTTNRRVRIERLVDDSGTVHGRAMVKFLFDATDYTDSQS